MRMKGIAWGWILLWAVLAPCPRAPAGEPAEARRKEIERLVRDLGSEDFRARETATDRLIEIGMIAREEVLAALPKEEESDDPEIRVRVETIRRAAAPETSPRRFPKERGTTSIAMASAGPDGAQGFVGKISLPAEWIQRFPQAGNVDGEVFALADLVLTDLEDPDPELRRKAVEAIPSFQGGRPKALLLEGIARLLDSRRAEVRAAAVEAAAILADEDWESDAEGIAAAKAWTERKRRRAKAGK